MNPAIEVIRNRKAVSSPGSPAGDQKRDDFASDLMSLFGDTPLLWLPKNTDTINTTDASLNQRTITYDATVAARRSNRGSGIAIEFDGSANEADTPDTDNLSFGNGASDEPFSIVSLVKPDTNDTQRVIIAKQNSTSAEEYLLQLTSAGHPELVLYDESASATIAMSHEVAVGTDWVLLTATYNGNGSTSGIRLYKNGLAVTGTVGSGGTYVAMENTAALLHIGARYTVKQNFFDGGMALNAIVAGEISPSYVWAMKQFVNGFFDLSL